ncbi:MAG TPA: ROK family protein [Jatrophihabitantaceae bacterium]|nr:ROK family protein [Jatrophihabitantaceae bacterium]
MPRVVPVLEIGGTHATAALVDLSTWAVSGEHRVDVDGQATAADILDAFAAAGQTLTVGADAAWGVAMPDPFDYARGIGHFQGVGKFESLDGVDVRAALGTRLPGDHFVFCNDADAFTLGEWLAGAGRGYGRVTGLTLGTGVGSGWVDAGEVADPVVPSNGRAHHLWIDGGPLEDTVSRRAIRAAYASATGDADSDVREIADRARDDDPAAVAVLAHAFRSLGRALGTPIRDFGAEVVVIGGSMAGSWALLEPWFREGAADVRLPPLRVAARPDSAPLVGAAYVAAR